MIATGREKEAGRERKMEGGREQETETERERRDLVTPGSA